MKGLRSDRKGANPLLHLASGHILADPEAWATFQTVRDARELGGFERVEACVGLFADAPSELPRNGPVAILVARLQRVGWTFGANGLVQDRFGCFSLFDVSWDELCLRLTFAWPHVLATDVAHRSTFGGLKHVDLGATQKALSQFGSADQVYLRCHLDGTLFVQNGRAKFQEGISDQCLWCGERDGFLHRAWQCPHFEQCRAHLTPEQRSAVSRMPECFSVHGWAVSLAEWELFMDFLLSDDGFCRMSPVGIPPIKLGDWLDLFVDGACAHPREPKLRYGAWAATMATQGPGHLDNCLILGGHLRGMCQSAFRAELAAVYYAMQWASSRCMRLRLWSDCLGVVNGVRKLLRGAKVRPNRAHSDLWQRIAALLAESDMWVQILKVVSHCSVQEATSPEEEWAYWHNQLTDQAATAINGRRTHEFWVAWENLSVALTKQRQLHMAVLTMLLKQSRLANAGKSEPKPRGNMVQPSAVALPAAPTEWRLPESLFQRYGEANVVAMHEWWSQCGTAALSSSETGVGNAVVSGFFLDHEPWRSVSP